MRACAVHTDGAAVKRVAAAFVTLGALGAPLAVACSSDASSDDSTAPPDATFAPETSIEASPEAGLPPGCSVAWCETMPSALTAISLNGIWGTSRTDVWVVGNDGTAFHFDGTTWQPRPTHQPISLSGVWGAAASDVWAFHGADAIFRFDPAASSWAVSGVGTLALDVGDGGVVLSTVGASELELLALAGSGPGDVRALATYADARKSGENLVLHYGASDGGTAGWTLTPLDPPGTHASRLLGMWIRNASERWVFGESGQLYRLSDVAGVPPRVALVPVDSKTSVALHAAWGIGDELWVVGAEGTIRHASGGGAFVEVASPTRETLLAIWGASNDDVWAVGTGGTILHWDGKSWSPSASPFDADSSRALRGVWGASADEVWIVGERTLLRSTGGRP
jgi:hypothetical protein